jgi:hypothetical protein
VGGHLPSSPGIDHPVQHLLPVGGHLPSSPGIDHPVQHLLPVGGHIPSSPGMDHPVQHLLPVAIYLVVQVWTTLYGTPTKRQVSKRKVLKRQVSKCLKCQVYKTSALQNVRFTKCQVYKTSGLQNIRLQKNIHTYSVLVVGGNPQVLLQPCLQAK